MSKYVVCSASKVDRACNHSLIFRGSNGGVAGEDIHIRFTHHDHRVDIRGTDYHYINSAPIGTSGGVTKTTI